jgi:hypothetical protein
MNHFKFASKITSFTNVTGNQLVENGEPIRVYGIVMTNTLGAAARNLEVRTGDGNTLITTLQARGDTTVVHDIQFIADKGLSLTFPNTIDRVTVFHSHPGS